ncbi:lipid droplet-regulating VLDL assembly factor AUP1 isoform X2 [Anolis carolinensis]|uniref:lipid droplet-regulating VLDL assembly factor AUP1 isoform X2 n=1 Tax=Anolis carolinensis TaxID=28377 RepID=UPI000462630A|nr:PREDICTED: ancient ubiquitous protein 1 [Anolis carolinensis]|eukprot:XP_008121500.1 PREDICTED: ancient ubiquitous protein 1 [Anolis carolinensis]
MDPAPASAAAAASPSPVGPERLFDSHRLPGDGLLAVALLLYAPVGLCLLLLRLFVGLHVFLVSCALPDSAPRRFVVRAMCAVLGLLVRQSSPRRPPSRLRLLVANHITPFDHNVLSLLLSCGAPVLNGASGFLCWSRGFLEVGPTDSRSELLESLKAYSSQGGNPPLLLFPEETTTNGRVGLLRFSTWPFSISDTVQPVALQVQRPFVSVSVADASWVTELLWTFFVPFTVYQVRWLPSVCRQAEETREEFALRVQELLASELGLVSTRLTAADKAEYLKRLRHSPRNSYSSPAPNQPAVARSRAPPIVASAEDVHLMELAQRVKEVLPHVPLAVICKDLAQTNCVDATIANLLEGRVPFTPSEEGEAATAEASLLAPSGSGAHSPPASPPVTPSAAVFARSPEARHLSLQERKRVLYDYARRRFTERHGTMAQREGSR